MNFLKQLINKDNFFWGALMGFFFPAIVFIIIRLIASSAGNDQFAIKPLGEDSMQVYAIVANLIPFRFYMINKQLDRTGRGLIFATFVLVIIYFIMFFQYKERMGLN
jgi:hypothetical protein